MYVIMLFSQCICIYLVIVSLSLEKKLCGKLRQKLLISEIKIDLKAGDRKQKKSQLHEKKNKKHWSCGADGWRGGVWKADGRGRSISLFQLLAGTNTDDKVATLSLFLSPLSRSLFSFPLHFPRIWFPSFFPYHISRADIACSLWHLLIVQGKSPATSPSPYTSWMNSTSHHPSYGDHTSFGNTWLTKQNVLNGT